MICVPESFSIALHALVLVAGKPGGYQSGKRIAEACQVSAHHLSKVLASLARAGLLESQRGPSGGVCFRRKPEEVTLSMIRDAIEGQAVPRKGCLLPYDVCPGNRCAAGRFLFRMAAELQRVLKVTTLADVLRSINEREEHV